MSAASATFAADFNSILKEIDRVDNKLSTLELKPKGVEAAFDRMQRSFSGAAIVQQAEIAIKAVESIGGVTKLTADEQRRLNTTVNEAINKYTALGQTAPKHLTDVADATASAEKKFSSVLGVIKQIGPALGISLSVGAVINFAKSVGDFAGKMLDLNAQTQISTDRLQAFDVIAGDVGLTVEDVVTSADQLAKRLGGDDKSVNEALAKLNLQADKLKGLSLDEVMFEIDKSLLGVGNQMDRARILSDLFGKSGAQLGRIMTGSMKEATDAIVKAGDTIDREILERADKIADAWGRAWKRFRAEAIVAIDAVGRAFYNAFTLTPTNPAAAVAGAGAIKPMASHGLDPMTMVASHTKRAADILDVIQGQGVKSLELQAKFTALVTTGADQIRPGSVSSQGASQGIPLGDLFGKQLPKDVLGDLMGLPQVMREITHETAKANTVFDSFFSGIKGGFKELWQGMSGGGGLGGLLKGIGGGITQGIGQMLSGGLTSLISGGLGKAVEGIGKLFGKLFGSEGKKTNDLRDKTFEAAGGFQKLAKDAAAAGVSIDGVLKAKKVKDFEAAWADLQQRMGSFADETAADQERLTAAMEKYGITADKMGSKFKQNELNAQAKELIEDRRVLIDAGADLSLVNEKMSTSTNEFLKNAIKFGSEVPSAMRPVLESMIKQGTLLDENGEVITDLEKAGIHFSQTMTEGFDRVVKKLDEFIRKLGIAGDAIADMPTVEVGDNFGNAKPWSENYPTYPMSQPGASSETSSGFASSHTSSIDRLVKTIEQHLPVMIRDQILLSRT